MTLVVDSSAALAWLLEEPRGATAARILLDASGSLFAPSVFWFEVPYVLGKQLSRGRITLRQRDLALERTQAIGIKTDLATAAPGAAYARMMALGDQFGLSAYDSAFFELALRIGAELFTYDMDLAAAGREAGLVIWGHA